MDKIIKEAYDCHELKRKGYSRKEIGEILGLTTRQVKSRLASEFINSGAMLGSGEGRIVSGTIDSSTISSGKITGDYPYNSTSIINTPAPMIKDGTILWENLPGSVIGSRTGTQGKAFVADDYPAEWDEKDVTLFSYEEVDAERKQVTDYIASKYRGKEVKILNLSDLHIPFTDYKLVKDILSQHRDANIVMINGDLLDLFAVSKFAKDKEIALRREIQEGREFLEYISNRFEDVVITDGNHERRLRSFIKNMIPTDMQFLFPQDVLKLVTSGETLKKKELKNVKVVGSWWVKLFDIIYAHPDNYNGANLKTVQNTSEYFMLNRNEPHRMCVIGHTHRAGWLMSGGVKLMETGCLCHDMDYHMGSKFTRARWTKGYSVAYVGRDGRVDLKRSVVNIEEE